VRRARRPPERDDRIVLAQQQRLRPAPGDDVIAQALLQLGGRLERDAP
jgi:hypothetical protein